MTHRKIKRNRAELGKYPRYKLESCLVDFPGEDEDPVVGGYDENLSVTDFSGAHVSHDGL
jgi:hypothetical protein